MNDQIPISTLVAMNSASISNLAAALVKAQSEFPAIPRTKEVTVSGQRGSYKFSYAPFEDILRAVKPVLAANGLAFVQSAVGDKLVTVILHRSGEATSCEVAIVNPAGTAQSYGSALTYSRRYGFCAAFGIQADDDDDANAADGNTVTQTRERGSARPAHTGAEMKKNAFEDMPPDEQEFLRKAAATLRDLIDEKGEDVAYGWFKAQRLDTEEELALSSLLDRKTQGAINRARANDLAMNNAAERNKHQQSRPEQRIPN